MHVTRDSPIGGSLWVADDSSAVVRRVWYATPIVGAALVSGATVFGSLADVAGVVAGVALAMLNFRSLQNSLRGILDAGHQRAPSGTTLMFAFRWIIVATIAFALNRLGVASLVGVVSGLFAPAIAIGLEALFQMIHALRIGSNDLQE